MTGGKILLIKTIVKTGRSGQMEIDTAPGAIGQFYFRWTFEDVFVKEKKKIAPGK